MRGLSLDLRKRVVAHYEKEASATYTSTAKQFVIGRATVNRWLRLKRETGEVKGLPPKNRPKFKVDLGWLKAHAESHPDARLKDRAEAWMNHAGTRVSVAGVWGALRALGFTHKKRRSGPKSASFRESKR